MKENTAYKEFLKDNLELLGKPLRERKLLKIHVLISQHVKTRTPSQCRSHHQKMLKYYKDLRSIIAYIEEMEEAQQS